MEAVLDMAVTTVSSLAESFAPAGLGEEEPNEKAMPSAAVAEKPDKRDETSEVTNKPEGNDNGDDDK